MQPLTLTKLSARGQLSIPKKLRERMGLEPGETFAVFESTEGLIIKRLKVKKPVELEEILAWGHDWGRKRGITDQDIEEAVAQTRAERAGEARKDA